MSGYRPGSGAKKKAIRVNIKDVEVIGHQSEYVCPGCKTHCTSSISSNVTRFRCIFCERELIINSRKRET